MTVTIHRSECALYRGEHLIQTWNYYRFQPRPAAFQTTEAGFRKSRLASVPIAVTVPVGSRMEGNRLVTFAGTFDASSVYHLAKRRAHGFRFEEKVAS